MSRSLRVLTALALAACHGKTSAPPPPAPVALDESEPNDTAFEAPWFGALSPGVELAIAGHVTSSGPDLYDGFAFTTSAPCTVRFVLTPTLLDTDLDLCVFDPWLDAFVACFDSPSGTETGEIAIGSAGVDFHLVVTSAWASSSYLLEIQTIPYFPYPAVSEGTSDGSAKGTLDRIDGYRRRESREPLAIGWIGEVDLESGDLERTPFAVYRGGVALGSSR